MILNKPFSIWIGWCFLVCEVGFSEVLLMRMHFVLKVKRKGEEWGFCLRSVKRVYSTEDVNAFL